MMEMSEIIKELRRPFLPSRVDWKVQTVSKAGDSAMVVAYVDARDVAERLNKVCPDQWSTKYREIIYGNELHGVECTLTIRTDSVAISRADVGIGDDSNENIGVKTLWSDSLKRAGVHFGINSCAYELPTIWLKGDDKLYMPGGKIKGLQEKGKKELTDRYAKWVTSDAIVERFGVTYEA